MNIIKPFTKAATRLQQGDGHWQTDRTDEEALHATKMLRRTDRIAMTLFMITGVAILALVINPASITARIAAAVLGAATMCAILYADHGTRRWQETADMRWVWHHRHTSR